MLTREVRREVFPPTLAEDMRDGLGSLVSVTAPMKKEPLGFLCVFIIRQTLVFVNNHFRENK